MKKENADNKVKGDQFEAYIGTLYQSLGYRLSYNIQLSGQQVDILAEKIFPGAGPSKIAIECKYQSNGNISNQKVQDFISTSENLIRNDGITKAIMVTNAGYTDTAWAAAAKNQLIELMTQRSLEDHLFDLASTYRSFVDTYEATEIFNEYVELNGLHADIKGGKEKIENVEEFLISWLEEPHNRLMTVFGDFGSGKTTVLNRIKYVFAKAFIEGRSALKPFFIHLKDFYKYDTLDKLLTYSAIREFEREVSLQLIYKQIESGQIILLLDGFDEMAQQVDTDIRMRNFLHLAPLLRQRSIITCRPSYFISKNEYIDYSEQLFKGSALRESTDTGSYKRENMQQREIMNQLSVFLSQEFHTPQSLKTMELLDFEVVEIAVLSSNSIDDYLKHNDHEFKRVLGYSWSYVKNYLLQIYDISDLMTRPMLLKMIVKTLLSGKLQLTGKQADIGPAGLYELYTSLYLDIDFRKGTSRQLFTAEQRRSLSISIALLMLEQRSLEVSYEKLLDFITLHPDIKNVLGDITHLTFEQIVADMQICTFLVPSESGQFRFAHKSFMEFFVARYLKKHITDTKTPADFYQMLPKEVLYFLGSYCTIDNKINTKLSKWLDTKDSKIRDQKLIRNAASTILYAGAIVTDLEWDNLEISYIEFKRRALKNVKLDSVNIINVDFINSSIFNNEWQSVHLRHIKFSASEIHGTHISSIVDDIKFIDCVIGNSNINLSGKDILWRKVEIGETKLCFSGNTAISDCNFNDTTINWQTFYSGEITFSKCNFIKGSIIWPVTSLIPQYRFSESRFIGQHITLPDTGLATKIFERCTFDKCELAGIRLDIYNLTHTSFIDCQGYLILEERAIKEPQLEPFKQPGNILFFKRGELYYLPEQTWEKCGRDFKTFKQKITL
ncbi:MAG: NACHT domain-containing protein [Chryseobacterium sp.]|nr:MAG: NACHT domain-containing protein [Chryseobacterium sp.]